MREHFHLFVYGTLKRDQPSADLLAGAEWLGPARLGGMLYDIDGQHPALVVYGNAAVDGEVWKCPVDLLPRIDAYESVDSGLFRRIGITVMMADGSEQGCWTYVAGPKITRKLVPAARVDRWPATARA